MSGRFFQSQLLENALIYRGAVKNSGQQRPPAEVVLNGQAALEPGDLVVRYIDGETQPYLFLNSLSEHPEWSNFSESLTKDDLPWYEMREVPHSGNPGIDTVYPIYNERTVLSPSVMIQGDPLVITRQILVPTGIAGDRELTWINIPPHLKRQEKQISHDMSLYQGIVSGYAANVQLGTDGVSSDVCIQSLADFLPDTMGDINARIELLSAVLPGLFKDGQTPWMIDAVRALDAKTPLAHKLGFSAQKSPVPEQAAVNHHPSDELHKSSRPKM